jgi:HEAT repeat protein
MNLDPEFAWVEFRGSFLKKSEDLSVRWLLLLWLAGCSSKPQLATSDLIERLAVRGPEAYNLLLERKQDADIDLVVAALGHRRSRVRAACARLLGSYQDVTRVDPMLPLLDDPVASVRESAAESVFRLCEVHDVLALLARAETSLLARQALLVAVLAEPDELAEPEWLDWLLGCRDDSLQASMFAALARHPRPAAQGERKHLLAAYDRLLERARSCAFERGLPWELRVQALEFITSQSARQALPLVLYWAGSSAVPDYVREAALLMLGRCGQSWLLDYLRAVVEDQAVAARLRRAALAASLKYLEPEPAAQFLQEQARDQDPRYREAVYSLLASHPRAFELLSQAGRREVNREQAAALSRLLVEAERRLP